MYRQFGVVWYWVVLFQHGTETMRNTSWKSVRHDVRKAMLMLSFWYLSRILGVCFVPHCCYILDRGSLETMPREHMEFYTQRLLVLLKSQDTVSSIIMLFCGLLRGPIKSQLIIKFSLIIFTFSR